MWAWAAPLPSPLYLFPFPHTQAPSLPSLDPVVQKSRMLPALGLHPEKPSKNKSFHLILSFSFFPSPPLPFLPFPFFFSFTSNCWENDN